MRLDGKVVLVTGAGQGIGRGIAVAAAREGAAIGVLDRNPEGVARTVDAVEHAGGRALGLVADVTVAAEVAHSVEATVQAFGRLTGVVNNAGILREGTVVDLSEDDWHAVLAVNLTAPFLVCKHTIPYLVAAGGGSIVNICSIEALMAKPNHVAYAATKAGLLNLTRCVAVEWGRRGVRANAVCPGSIDTEMFRGHVERFPDPQQALSDLVDKNFAGRLGTVEDVGLLAVYLLSDESGFTNGATHVIDGARTATA